MSQNNVDLFLNKYVNWTFKNSESRTLMLHLLLIVEPATDFWVGRVHPQSSEAFIHHLPVSKLTIEKSDVYVSQAFECVFYFSWQLCESPLHCGYYEI